MMHLYEVDIYEMRSSSVSLIFQLDGQSVLLREFKVRLYLR